MAFATLLKRVFKIDITTCIQCGGLVSLVALIQEPCVIKKILDHLGLPNQLPSPKPSRYSHLYADVPNDYQDEDDIDPSNTNPPPPFSGAHGNRSPPRVEWISYNPMQMPTKLMN
jgi:hypothetical protein